MSEQLDALWNAYRETPFTTASIQRKLDLPTDALADIRTLLNQMSKTGDTRNGC